MRKISTFKKFKGPKGKDLSIFVRFGGLDLKNQKGHTKNNPTYHSPPTTRGFYAFPKSMQELFLIGSMDKFQPHIFPKDKIDWDKLSYEEGEKQSQELDIRHKKIRQRIRKEFVKTSGNIWHHLGDYCKPQEIIDTHGSWVKTTIQCWQKAFSKRSLNDRYGEDFGTGKGRGESSINNTRGLSGYYSKDDYEVFFDEKV
jgi:hypothetical protein